MSKTYSVKITVPNKGSDYITIVGPSCTKIAKKLSEIGIIASEFKEVSPKKAQLSIGDK